MSTPNTPTSTVPPDVEGAKSPYLSGSGRSPLQSFFSASRKELGIFGLLLALCIVVAVMNHQFLSADNLMDLGRRIGIYAIFGIGMGVVIITSGIDLSVGSVFSLLAVLLALALGTWHWPPIVAVLGVFALTMGIGLIQGLLISRVPLQPFIVTLCGLMIIRGLSRFVSNDQDQGYGDGTGFHWLINLSTGNICIVPPSQGLIRLLPVDSGQHGLPMEFVIMIIVAAIMWVVLHRSVYGRYLFAVGRNEEAARYSGINSKAIITSAYVVSGVLAAIAGILLAFYTDSISPSLHGASYELYGIAAAVLGGCSLRGGEGSVIGVLIGTALLQVLQNLVNLLGIPSSLNFAVVGGVILIGVITDEIVKKRSARKV